MQRAAEAFDAYRAAFGRGDDDEAQRQFDIFRDALQQARDVAGSSGATPPADTTGTDTTGTDTTGTDTTGTESCPPTAAPTDTAPDQTAEVQPLDTTSPG